MIVIIKFIKLNSDQIRDLNQENAEIKSKIIKIEKQLSKETIEMSKLLSVNKEQEQ